MDVGEMFVTNPKSTAISRQEAHRPVVMALGRGTAFHRNQVSRLETREGTASVLLHFIV